MTPCGSQQKEGRGEETPAGRRPPCPAAADGQATRRRILYALLPALHAALILPPPAAAHLRLPQLARFGLIIEEHYSRLAGEHRPMDVEWAKDGVTGELFIVQAREPSLLRLEMPGWKHYCCRLRRFTCACWWQRLTEALQRFCCCPLQARPETVHGKKAGTHHGEHYQMGPEAATAAVLVRRRSRGGASGRHRQPARTLGRNSPCFLVAERFSSPSLPGGRSSASGWVQAKGKAVGARIGSGRVRVIMHPDDMGLLQEGEVLVTDMTDPDW